MIKALKSVFKAYLGRNNCYVIFAIWNLNDTVTPKMVLALDQTRFSPHSDAKSLEETGSRRLLALRT